VIDAGAVRRLAAMEIPVWRARVREPVAHEQPGPAGESPREAGAPPPAAELPQDSRRIRLEAGSGRWLLVVDDADRARYSLLIEDIRATLGVDDCRFGTWSDSPESGVGVSDWQAHGIRCALVFERGEPAHDGFLHVGTLEGLAASGAARKALWQQLKPLLED